MVAKQFVDKGCNTEPSENTPLNGKEEKQVTGNLSRISDMLRSIKSELVV